MKRSICAVLAAGLILPCAAANAYDDKGIHYEVIENLNDEAYYTISAEAENPDINSDTVLFAGSERTFVPLGGSTVCLRGVKPENGRIIVGWQTDPQYDVKIENISVSVGEEYEFLAGGDMTQINYIEALGGRYYDADGTEGDPFSILAGSGMQLARIRLSNTTGKGTGDGHYYLADGFQDLDDCLDLCRRAKDAGMQIEFTFNLSDYWSNAERQIIPSEWSAQIKEELGYDLTDTGFLKSMTSEQRDEIIEALTETVHSYVRSVMEQLKAQDTVPEYVSIGNEVNGGLLFPFGASFDMQLSCDDLSAVWGDDRTDDDIIMPADTAALAGFMNAGYDAVKEVSPDTQVVIHLANGAKLSSYTWALDIFNDAGAKYDILGASYYPAWSNNTVEGCVEFCNEIYKMYGKPIMIMETGFNWNETIKNGKPGQLIDIDAYKDKYPPTKDGQKAYLADLYNGLKSVDNGACIGAIYWDPVMIHVEDPNAPGESLSGWAVRESDDKTEPNIVENTTLFDFDGKALPVLDVMRLGGLKPADAVIARYDENGILTGTYTLSTAAKSSAAYNSGSEKLFVFSK